VITHVRGLLTFKAPTFAVVDVGGDGGGIGYGIAISLFTYDKLPAVGTQARLVTYHYVREDRQQLFGFAEQEEREAFVQLIGISGIGPSSAQTILSGMSVSALHEAIYHERVSELTSIKGIGRKTAERMVVELKDKIHAVGLSSTAGGNGSGDVKAGTVIEEAVLALVALGFTESAARQSVAKAAKNGASESSVQELIKRALKER
jgi:Holliday junction DNA helicase RuvA